MKQVGQLFSSLKLPTINPFYSRKSVEKINAWEAGNWREHEAFALPLTIVGDKEVLV